MYEIQWQIAKSQCCIVFSHVAQSFFLNPSISTAECWENGLVHFHGYKNVISDLLSDETACEFCHLYLVRVLTLFARRISNLLTDNLSELDCFTSFTSCFGRSNSVLA